MNFYPKHNRSVFDMIVEAQKSGNLIPFVGAGMSVFCGYKLWGAVLYELAEFIPSDDKRKQDAIKHINDCRYAEAAQTIFEAYPPMLDQLPGLISPDKLNDCPQEKLRASAAFTLPYLFQKGLVITTNFDRVLETVYHSFDGKQIETVTPNQQDRLAQLRQNQSLGLFKLHGDIGSDTVSRDDLVFTGKQYGKKYESDSPLVQELTRWFENRILLFLGCSLSADQTMEVLKRVTKDQSGIRHYAILGCKKSDFSKRLKELSDLGILPIFYDDSDHDAVRVILERLLEKTNQESYKNLLAASRVAPAVTKEERRLLFDTDYFPFTGRKKELEALKAFCDSDENISWWAVTGPGGMGKSRLVYEFTNQRREDGWQIKRFEAHPSKDSKATEIEALEAWFPGTSRTIVVLDDVQAHMERVRTWLTTVVRRPRSEKLRILLLEREGKDLDSSSWLGVDPCNDIPGEWCYDENFLCVEPMTNEDLMSIMNDYAAASGKKLNAELLLKTLERVDPELKRPLYAIAIADARCQGKDPTNWDRKMVLDTLLERELSFHFNRLRGMIGTKVTKTLLSQLKELLARSCIHGFLPLEDVEEASYPQLVKKINDIDMDLSEFLEGLGVLRTVLSYSIPIDEFGTLFGEPSEEERKVIALSCPDLIKEHLVLNLVLEKGKKELLFPQDWEQNPGRLDFLVKLLADYSDRLKEQRNYWNTFFQAKPRNVLPASIYGHILWGYIAKYPDDARRAIDRLSQLYNEMNHAPEIAVAYAKGLVNLTVEQDLMGCTETIARLDKLCQNHPDIPEIAVAYANGLVNLTAKQDLNGHTETIAKLDELYQNHSDISEIADAYAKGLVNLTVEQDLKGCTETIAKLYELYQNHPDTPEVAIEYAKGLVNLTVEQDLKGCTETVAKLYELYQKHPDWESVAAKFTGCLVNFSLCQQSETEVLDTLTRSRAILDRYPENNSIQLDHAMTWFNLTLQQQDHDIHATVEDIAAFLRSNAGVIPQFKEALDEHLANHPDHADRYQLLLHL